MKFKLSRKVGAKCRKLLEALQYWTRRVRFRPLFLIRGVLPSGSVWRGSQVVRQRFAKPLYVGSNPILASKKTANRETGNGLLVLLLVLVPGRDPKGEYQHP